MQQTSQPSHWPRVCGVALTSLTLIFVLILLLQSGLVQAGSQLPDDNVAGARLNSPRNALGTPALTITVEATSTTVVPGQTVTYTIEFHHVGGTSPLQGRLFNPFQSATYPHNDGMLVQVTGSVTPTSVQVSYGTPQDEVRGLHWQGSIAPDSRLQIRYSARVEACYDPNPVTIQNVVAVQGQDGGSLTDSAAIQVDCLPAVDPANISVSGFWGSETVNEFVPGKTGFYQIELTNSDPNPTVLGLVGIFPSRNLGISMPTLQRVTTLGWKVEEGGSRSSSAAGTQNHLFLLPLAAGETRVIQLPTRLAQDVPPESVFEAQLGYCITYDGRFCPSADPQSTTPPTSLKWLPPISFTVRYRDLGDAPDSTTHFTTSLMSAYTGVQANFPTVFDPSTGPDQGPTHLNPRPFHLGRRVSPETEADIGPDLDPTNNIIPATNIASRDRRDNGLAVNLLNFSQCQAGVVPVRVLIRPAAVAFFQKTGGKGYLNLWLDGNHDGDWADNFQCPQAQTAVEHIVIDHQIDVVALGAGLHILPVRTGLVPWSGQAAWLRATLSEQPANKTLNAGGINYGDGRGYGAPFLLGETEDYLLRPPGAEGAGPDMSVDLAAGWRTIVRRAQGRFELAQPSLEIHLTASYFKIDYRNEGSETATDVLLSHFIPSALQNIAPRIVAVPQLGDGVVFKLPGRINISLGDLEPDAGGSIVLSWTGCLTCTRSLSALQATSYTGTTTIQSSDDINLDNNQADSSVDIPEVIEVGFSSPDGLYQRTSGVTCHNTVELRGRTSPKTALNIFSDGFESGDIIAQVTSGPDGTFEQLISLDNGLHRLLVVPQNNIVKRIDKATPLLTIMTEPIAWNPSSLTFIDSQGRAIQPTVIGFENQAGWYGHLKADETYQMSLEYCGSDPNPVIQVFFLGQTITLTDMDGDGVYIAEISQLPGNALAAQGQVAASAPLTISITSGNVETVFGGTIQSTSEGVVYDIQSGQALSAPVTLLQAIDADSEVGFDLWPGADYGQANPQTSSDGEYAFWPEGGTYHLAVSRKAYQPYRSWDVQTTGEPVNLNLPLTPEITEAPDYIIEIGPDGFEPSLLTVTPGSIIKWVNTDIGDHTSTSTNPALASPGTAGNGSWDSGRLSSGESYALQFPSEGTFTYVDRANPSNTAQIQVASNVVYLPMIIR